MQTDTGGNSNWLRMAMDSMHERFGLLAPDFTILELNKEAMRFDGRVREDVIGQSHRVAYPGADHNEVGKLCKTAMAERASISLEHSYEWTDGRTSWFETRAFPVENGCLAVFFRDVTELLRDNQDRNRIASLTDVPERLGHCLT